LVRIVVRLSPLAWAGLFIAVAGVVLGLYGQLTEVDWPRAPSLLLVIVGAVLYAIARVRMIRKARGR
jgi:drug/metabolite transporter (DMT)-like permease